MKKNNIKQILIDMRTQDNAERIDYLLKSLDEITDEDLNIRIQQLGISEDNIKQFLSDLIEKTKVSEEPSQKFVEVNDWFCYGRTGSTIHMHLIPKDLRDAKKELGDEAFYLLFKEQLEDFLAKMQVMFLEDNSIKSLFAVSPIFYNSNVASIHESLGFDKITEIDLSNQNDRMSVEQKQHFLDMFNKGKKNKKVYYTEITREKLLGMKYSQVTEESYYLKH